MVTHEAAVTQERVLIRPYRAADLDALYRVCLLTAASGQDATSLFRDPDMPGHAYAAPYGLFEPSLAFVVEEPGSGTAPQVSGYIVGALDTLAFEARLDRLWWPRLRGRYQAPSPGIPFDQLTFEQVVARDIHHRPPSPGELTSRYPSHLHIDLLPHLQGLGLGRVLMSTLLDALRASGSRGVHLYCAPDNHRANGFYRHLGFRLLSPDSLVYVMELDGPEPAR